MTSRVPLPVFLLCCIAPTSAVAQDPSLVPEWDLRLRHEQVDNRRFGADAEAITLRLRVGLRLAARYGWNGLLEAEGVAASGRYNSGANGRVMLPQVIDPPGVELNQAWLGWKGASAAATLGRQRLQFDNQRWVGSSGWRQNEQTFDAVAFEFAPRKQIALRYAFLDRVHRVNGDDAVDTSNRERALSSHLFNAAWKDGKQQVSAYGYLHDDRDVATASSATWGLRWTGLHPFSAATLGWTLESARQHQNARNPQRFSHAYWLVEPSIGVHGTTARAGWEHLGGSGTHALQAPLATLHAFNGWADIFLATPAAGLEDYYIALAGRVGRERAGARPAWQVAWHVYRPDRGGGRYGREWNASLSLPVANGLSGMLKIADYRAAGFASDTRKLWLQVEYKGSR